MSALFSLWHKLVGTSICCIIGIVTIFLFSHGHMSNMLAEHEVAFFQQQFPLIHKFLEKAQRQTIIVADDMAVWDAAVRFSRGMSPNYIEKNWPNSSPLEYFRVDFIIIRNRENRELYRASARNIPGFEENAFNAMLDDIAKTILDKDCTDWTGDIANRGVSGAFICNDTLYLLACAPVAENYQQTAASGVVFVGFMLDLQFCKDLFRIELLHVGTCNNEKRDTIVPHEIAFVPMDEETGNIHIPISPLLGEDIIMLHMTVPRTMYRQAMRSLLYTECKMVGLFVLLFVLGWVYVWKSASMRSKACTDALTGVNNRNAYHKAVEQLVNSRCGKVGVGFIDLNDLKYINDTAGHEQGDAYIHAISDIFCKHFRKRDIFRIGGDEFVILCSGIAEDTFQGKVQAMQEQCETEYPGCLALGCAWEANCTDVEALIRLADQRMYDNKKALKAQGRMPR